MLDQLGGQLTYPDAVQMYGKAQADAMFSQFASNPQPTSYLDTMQQRGQDAAVSGLGGLMDMVQASRNYVQETPITGMIQDAGNLGQNSMDALRNYEDGDLGRYIKGVGQGYADQGVSGYDSLQQGTADSMLGALSGDVSRMNRGSEGLVDATRDLGSIAADASDLIPALAAGGMIKKFGGGLMDEIGHLAGGARQKALDNIERKQRIAANRAEATALRHGESTPDYKMQHTAPSPDGGFNLSGENIDDFMPDVLGPNGKRYYNAGHEGSDEAIETLQRMAGNPDGEVSIYRAVPEGVEDFNSGDWVTTVKSYADDHAEEGWHVLEKKVPAKEVWGNGDSVMEYGWTPDTPLPRTQTPEFKNWFGESKVIDDAGEPLTVYHGTKKNFDTFKTNYGDGLSFFSRDPKFAAKWPEGTGGLREATDRTKGFTKDAKSYERELFEKYSGNGELDMPSGPEFNKAYDEVYGKIKGDMQSKYGVERAHLIETQSDINVMPVNLSLQKPFDPRVDYKEIEHILADMPSMEGILKSGDHKQGNWVVYENKEVINELKNKGYDGIYLAENVGGPHDTIASFYPEQIKSIHNKGEYNPKSANILKSVAPLVGLGAIAAQQDTNDY